MTVEALSILIVFVAMIILFLRTGKKHYALVSTPLLVAPFFELISAIIGEMSKNGLPIEVRTLILLVGMAVTGVLIGSFAGTLKDRRAKTMYIALLGGFSVLLAIIFLCNSFGLIQ